MPDVLNPLAAGFVGKGQRIAPADLTAAAARLQCPLIHVQAVLTVESSGSGFDSAGRPKILFEPHILYRELAGQQGQLDLAVRAGLAYPRQGMQPYPPTSEANYQRLKRACLIDQGAALRSASWGVAQVMGFNFSVGGYASEQDMVQACMDSEAAQFGLLLGYCERNGLVKYLRSGNFLMFGRGYNGAGAAAAYAARLNKAVAWLRANAGKNPILLVPNQTGPTVQTVTLATPQPTADSLMDAEWLQIRSGRLQASQD